MTGTMTLAAAMDAAILHHKAGRLAEAERLYRTILAAAAQHPQAHFNIAALAVQVGQVEASLPHFKAALEGDPSQGQFWRSYADALLQAGQAETARKVLEQGISHGLAGPEVDDLVARADPIAAAVAHHKAGRLNEAETGYRRILEIAPTMAPAHSNLGAVLFELGRIDEAESCYLRALEIRPDCPDTLNNLALMRRRLGRVEGVEELYRRAIALNPDFPEAHNNLGSLLIDLARLDEAIAHLGRALALRPDFIHAHRNLLVAMLYHPSLDQDAIYAAHRQFGALHAQAGHPAHHNDPTPDRKLRIGYLSADFRDHPVARNLLPLIRRHDRAAVAIHCYAEVTWEDETTAAFRAQADCWRSTVGLSDREVADMVRADGIDILVCLAGRFDRNRPLVCAFRPAPVQISYHDVATSGLEAMDYIVSDRVLTPRHGTERFTERPLCLPHFYIGEMPPAPPAIRRRSGPVVFGSLNNPAKITEPVLDLWARLLSRVPDSRLYLRYFRLYEVPSLRRRVERALERHGLDTRRLLWSVAGQSAPGHLDLYNEIDIALDPFPFSGSTTTFEALAMGVPVVTLRGGSMVANWTASMLTAMELTGLIAGSPEDYLDIAAGLAADASRRHALRDGLRQRLAASSLCDVQGKTRQIERLYRAVWRRWCARRSAG
ncbi:tetratricopeptide repeat protein [Magnetospirillum sp. SS-4]|uniref:O-linked N-acetylglucosamine transferase, SPINDLY family protein n=1 Tax=Magnetospirillum sp. SS-4 TaxID=2681465 RepID=UPI00137D2278|nr:tetratricopeptide repeat protein [Magnetospirillum sp. SS-4]CAA7621751.1 putative TPR repeat-containing protein [Magnetospirillum sp. SS-4]